MAMILIWAYNGVLASGVSGPLDVFAAANHYAAEMQLDRRRAIQWRVESPNGRPVRTHSGLVFPVEGKIDPSRPANVILLTAPFVGALEAFIAGRSELMRTLTSALRRRHTAGTMIASYCTGAYLLAEAGLLDGRIATTHWARAAEFAKRYPRVKLRAHEILTEQEGVLCGGAVTSFHTLALRLVEIFLGAEVARTTAKALLIENRVSQMPYASLLNNHGHTDALIARAQQRMELTLREGVRLSELATYLAVSERTLNRRFKEAVGMAPLEYLQTLRVEIAKRLLETAPGTWESISERVGYGDASTFRQLFKRMTGVLPREYRRSFARRQLDKSLARDAQIETS